LRDKEEDDQRLKNSEKVNGKPISKDNFTKVSYTKNFKYLDKGKYDKGCEFLWQVLKYLCLINLLN